MNRDYKVVFHKTGCGDFDYLVNGYTRKEALEHVEQLNKHSPYVDGYFKIKRK